MADRAILVLDPTPNLLCIEVIVTCENSPRADLRGPSPDVILAANSYTRGGEGEREGGKA
jgi:hypothetical protein